MDVDVRTGPRTGKLEYFNPKTESYALVDAPGLDRGDFADLGGDAMIIIPDLVVTATTAGLGKAIGAGALAAGAGEYARLKICLLYTSPSPRDLSTSRMPSSA